MLSLPFSSVHLVHRVQHKMAPKLRAVQLPIRPHLCFVRTNNTPKCHRRRRGHPRLPHIQSHASPEQTQESRSKKRGILFFVVSSDKSKKGSKRKDLFFSTKSSDIFRVSEVLVCPGRIMRRGRRRRSDTDNLPLSQKRVKTNCDAREFLFLCPANVLVFLSLRSLDTRL